MSEAASAGRSTGIMRIKNDTGKVKDGKSGAIWDIEKAKKWRKNEIGTANTGKLLGSWSGCD